MTDKTAIIIGASRGLGLGLTKELAGRGYKVTASERSDSAALHEAAKAHASQIEIVKCDVTDADSVAAIGDTCAKASVDVLIVNAGIKAESDRGLADLTHGNVADILHTNATAPIQCALALLPLVKRGGTIAMMSSQLGSIEESSGGMNLYRISKLSQNMLARSLFEEHTKDSGVRVVSLHPGWVQTDMGGPSAPLDVETSVSGMADVLERESELRHVFLNYDGTPLPW